MSRKKTESKAGSAKTEAAPSAGMSAVRILASWVITAASLAVIAGFVYWAIAIGTRDPHDVPIIRAMEGPSRVAPDDPGGKTASHQGLAVNRVAARGGVAEPAQQVALAPEPDALSSDDPTLGEARTEKTEVDEPDVAEADPEEVDRSDEDLDALEIADQVAEAAAHAEFTNSDPALIPRDTIRGTEYSPARSERPHVRPSGLDTVIANVEPTSATFTSARLDSVPIGTRLVQLGAYDSRDLADAEWARLTQRHSDLLENKSQLVQEAESGGRRFFRLRAAGFGSLDESRTLCSALLARGTPCIPVTAR